MGIKLEYKMKKGEEYLYIIKVNTKREAKEGDTEEKAQDILTMEMIQKVNSINKKGNYELSIIVTPLEMLRNGEKIDIPKEKQTITMEMDKLGNIIKSSIPSPASQPPLPDKELNVGDTWEAKSTINMPELNKTIEMPFYYKLASKDEMIDNFTTAKIEVNSPQQDHDLGELKETISAKGQTYFDYKNGMLIKSKVNTDIYIEYEGGFLKNNIEVEVNLKKSPKTEDLSLQENQGFLAT